MRIAVTGTAGQVAQALARRGALAGIDITPVGRPQLDLMSPASIRTALESARPDVIVSAAAYTAVDQAEIDAETAFAVNDAGAGHVAAAARALGVPVLHLSTDYVFDGTGERPYREDDAPSPKTVYGASKLAGEAKVLEAGGSVFRTAWVYSPAGANFVKTMVRLAGQQAEVRVVADQIGSPTSADDIADALLRVAERQHERPDDAALCGLFHLAGSETAAWSELAQGVFDLLASHGRPQCQAVPIATSAYPTRAKRPANSRLDGAKLKATYGIELPGWRASLPGVVAQLV
ncbi:MAG: dTDP-4-dehydrorhamnose reductase [Micropepsaceae bacterium]